MSHSQPLCCFLFSLSQYSYPFSRSLRKGKEAIYKDYKGRYRLYIRRLVGCSTVYTGAKKFCSLIDTISLLLSSLPTLIRSISGRVSIHDYRMLFIARLQML